MKRMMALLLSAAMMVTLGACGDGETTGAGSESAPQAESEPVVQQSAELLEEFKTTGTIEETVLVDRDNVRITAMALNYSEYSADLQLMIENNRDEDLSFTSGTLGYSCNSVNGMMVADGYLNCDVAAGKKAMDEISFGYDQLRLYGIQEIADLELGISITDQNYDSTNLEPCRIETSLHGNYAYDPLSYQNTISGAAAQNTFGYKTLYFAADRLYEQAGVAVLSQALITNADGEICLLVEAENGSEEMRQLLVGNIVVNNLIVCDEICCGNTLAPGKRGIIEIELSSLLDERAGKLCGVESIGTVSFDLQQYTMEGAKAADEETVQIVCGESAPIDRSGEEMYNQNGVRIVPKAFLEQESGISDSVLILGENTGNDVLTLKVPRNTVSVNGFMVDCHGGTWELKPGQLALMELKLYKSDLEQIKVTEVEQMEFELEIMRGNNTVDKPTLSCSFGK